MMKYLNKPCYARKEETKMNINDIKIPTFKESWKDFTDNYTLNQPLFFVLIQNKYLMQYADGYLYPVPFEE